MASKNAPSRKKALGYYNPVKNKKKEGAAAGGGMTQKVLINIEKITQEVNLKQPLLNVMLKLELKLTKDKKHFAVGQEVGLVKEVKQRVEGGIVKG